MRRLPDPRDFVSPPAQPAYGFSESCPLGPGPAARLPATRQDPGVAVTPTSGFHHGAHTRSRRLLATTCNAMLLIAHSRLDRPPHRCCLTVPVRCNRCVDGALSREQAQTGSAEFKYISICLVPAGATRAASCVHEAFMKVPKCSRNSASVSLPQLAQVSYLLHVLVCLCIICQGRGIHGQAFVGGAILNT